MFIYMCQGLNFHYFHIIGDGRQPNSRGLYTHYKDSYQRWDGHSQKNATFDHGTYGELLMLVVCDWDFCLQNIENDMNFHGNLRGPPPMPPPQK